MFMISYYDIINREHTTGGKIDRTMMLMFGAYNLPACDGNEGDSNDERIGSKNEITDNVYEG